VRVFVTGANGLLGSTLCRVLHAEGHAVRGLVRPASNRRSLEGLPIELVEGDVTDERSMRKGADGCDLMFHVAAVFSYFGYSKEQMFRTAKEGSIIAAGAAKDAGVKRIVLTSSTVVLGWRDEPGPLTEQDQLAGEAPDYFVTKQLQERTLFERAKELGIEALACNPSMFVGPQDYRPSEALFSITSYLADPLKLSFGGGVNIAHAEDIARGHILLADKGRAYERHILCSPDNWEWSQIHRTISELAGVAGPRISVGRTSAIAGATLMELGAKLTRTKPLATRDLAKMAGRYFWYDGSKARALGFTARGTRETLRETIGWLAGSPHLPQSVQRKLKLGRAEPRP
jgi:dihydroflavonol-4-reductase